MVSTVEVQSKRFVGELVVFRFCYVSRLSHLVEHDVASLRASLRITYRIKQRRILTQTDERGSLASRQILRFLIKICISSCLYAHRIMKEIKIIKV